MNEKPKFELTVADRAELPEVLHLLAEEKGPEILRLICEAGVAREAGTLLTRVLYQTQHQQGLQALRVLMQAFNTVSAGLAQAKGWTNEELIAAQAECERILEAQIVMAQKGRIILPH